MRPEVDEQCRNGGARVRQCRVVSEADAGRISEHEEVRLIQAQTWVYDAGSDTPSIQHCRVLVLEERDGGEDCVREAHAATIPWWSLMASGESDAKSMRGAQEGWGMQEVGVRHTEVEEGKAGATYSNPTQKL